MEKSDLVMKMVSSGVLVALLLLLLHLYNTIILKTKKIRRKLRLQGIGGPPPSFLYGNLSEMQKIQFTAAASQSSTINHSDADLVSHDYTSTLFPYFQQWRKEYGPIYTYSTGTRQHLYVNEPEIVKELNQSKSLDLGKPTYLTKRLAPMLGNGVIRSNGLLWAQQRKIIAPEFYMDKVKGMVRLIAESAQPMLKRWEECVELEEGQGTGVADVRIDEDLRGVSADVLSRAFFGSSYSKGKHIFSKLRSLQKIISAQSFLFGISSPPRFSFRKKQNEVDILEKEIESLIWDAVKERENDCSSGKDLLQLILDGAVNDQSLGKDSSKHFIVDNCKNIYFAGHESTAVTASWCLMLLALHPEWQDRIRTELAQLCKNSSPDADSFLQSKTVTMVIQEVLRLYPAAAFVSREALQETQVGNVLVPKGVCLWTLIPTLHRDPEIWGPDANEFKPDRFDGGVSNACKIPHAYIPFGVGPRLCLGKNFAMVQLKILLCLIVSKFSFTLSPKYCHSPAYRMIVEPGHGVHILIRKI